MSMIARTGRRFRQSPQEVWTIRAFFTSFPHDPRGPARSRRSGPHPTRPGPATLRHIFIPRGLVAGRLSIREAAQRFGELAESQPQMREAFTERLREAYPDCSDEERLCRHVIDQARRSFDSDPARARLVAERLEADLRAST